MNQEGQGKGALIGTIIVIIILAIGGYYLWKQSGASIVSPETASDELNAIEADLTAAELDTFDADLSDLEADMQ